LADGIASLRDAEWLRAFWGRVVPRERQRLYAALVSADGLVVMHSDRSLQGQKLERHWFERRVREVGVDVVETQSMVLTSGDAAYDIQVPIEVNDVELGAYHSGFDAAWLNEAVAARRRVLYARWALMGALIVGIVLAAGVSLFHLARRTAALQHALGMARTQQLAELGRLAGTLAHEVRNPLNALRLNLHALERFNHDDGALSSKEMSEVLKESKVEIQRLEDLIRDILGYARPERARVVDVDLGRELAATANFIGQLIERESTTLRMQLPDRPVLVHIDRDRFRQMVLNLLNNARDAVGQDGEISIVLRSQDGWADISIEDSGPGIAPEHRDRIFDPFFSTKGRGCGLGLALVKRFAEEAGGTVVCDDDVARGARFRICLPEARRPRPVPEESTP
jgi:two-component system sensor histidine kinase HydH